MIKSDINNFLSKNIIDLSWDDYYINPYIFDKSLDNKNPSLVSANKLVDLINNITDKNLKSNLKSDFKKSNDSNWLSTNKSNDLELTEKPLNPLLFKIIANDNISQLESILSDKKLLDINEQDKDGDTPLHISVFLCNISAVKILLKYGADIYIKDKWGQTPLHRICFSMGDYKSIEIVELFIKNNTINNTLKNTINTSLFDLQDNYGNTICHLILKHLIKNKTSINENHKILIKQIYSQSNQNIKNIDGYNINDLSKNLDIPL